MMEEFGSVDRLTTAQYIKQRIPSLERVDLRR